MSIKFKSILNTIIQFTGAIVIGIYFDRLLEMCFIIPLFFIFRSKYDTTFHAKTIVRCTLYTLLMFIIVAILLQSTHISLFLTVIICYLITQILHYIGVGEQYIKVKRFKVYIGMPKDILLDKCRICNLSEVETKVLTLYYCDHLKRWQIGNILNYSEDNISKIKRRALDKFV